MTNPVALSRALTLRATGRLAVLRTEVAACSPFNPASPPAGHVLQLKKFVAIWDTGATGSVISEKVRQECGDLKPTGIVEVHGVHGKRFSETFLINLQLPNGVHFPNVVVTKGDIGGADILIGMDIISLGDFTVTNLGGQTVFTFRIPSCTAVDYVQEQVAAMGQLAPPVTSIPLSGGAAVVPPPPPQVPPSPPIPPSSA